MATVPSASHAAFSSVARRSYLATETYNGDFFSYAVTFSNNVYTGALSAVTGANGTNCPQGRILHETGKKLYPSANPGIGQYMVSVFDPVNMLTGFINPNNPTFSLMNTDRPAYIADSPSGTGTGIVASARANALYTRGDVLAGGRFDLSGSGLIYGNLSTIGNQLIAGNLSTIGNQAVGGSENVRGSITSQSTITAAAGVFTTAGQVRVNSTQSLTSAAGASLVINPTLCQVFDITLTPSAGGQTTNVTSSNESLVTGGVIYLIVSNGTGFSTTIDFGANFKTLSGGVSTVANGQTNTYSFFCNGANFFQISQCINISV